MTIPPADPGSYGQYDVERVLGRGAMGTVYLARDRRIGRRVALKTIRIAADRFSDDSAADDFWRRLQREAEVCGSLLHPNIVTLYEAGYDDGRISYLAMELVEGETLLAMMKRLRPEPLPVDVALRVAEDVLRALAHAHAKGIIHRDIKPANILLAADGTAKLADFGIARPQDSSMTGAGALIGTPNYMPPEQVLGKGLTIRADLFSAGVVLYEMLTAVKPFAGSDITTVLHNILRMEVASASEVNPDVPRPVGDFVARLMAKAPEARPTADEAVQQLGALRTGTVAPDTLVLADTVPPTSRLRRRVRPLPAAAIIVLLLALAAIPAAIIRSRTDSSPTVSIPEAQLAEFEAKRRALDEADALFDAGKFQESLERYEAYLQKYPHSIAARDGRDAAKLAIQQQKQGKPTTTRRKPRPEEEDISPSELLRRIRRKMFGR